MNEPELEKGEQGSDDLDDDSPLYTCFECGESLLLRSSGQWFCQNYCGEDSFDDVEDFEFYYV